MISFSSVENFYEECTTGIEFQYNGKCYCVEFDDPFRGIGTVRIHLQDKDGNGYFDAERCTEYPNLETLVHNYQIESRTLAEIICDENKISRKVLPIKRELEKWQADGNEVVLELHRKSTDNKHTIQRACYIKSKVYPFENSPVVKTEYISTSKDSPRKIISYGEPNYPEFWTFLFDEKDVIHENYTIPKKFHYLNLISSDNVMRYCYTAKPQPNGLPKYIIKDVINENFIEWAEIFSDNDPTSLWACEI